MLRARSTYLVLLMAGAAAASYKPRPPRFSWDTLPVFFHAANKSGPVTAAGLEIMAKFPMVTVEKFQWPADAHQEAVIVEVLKGVKAVNPNVSTIFYYNSVLDFPQYDLSHMMKADPSLMLHDRNGRIVKMDGGGHSDMDVFDFGNPQTRALFIEECVNATRSGYVDGCFCDRAVDGTPTDSGDDTIPCSSKAKHGCKHNLTDEVAQAYFDGHVQVLTELQEAIGEGPVIANHAYGPPHDAMAHGTVSFSMIEGFGPNNQSIVQLLTNVQNNRGVQAHGQLTEDCLAAFLIGAGYRAYFGAGRWWSASTFADRWSPLYDLPLGRPLADGKYDAKTSTWTRSFSANVNVTFDVHKRRGTIAGWNFPCY